jgi:hypothetical protein
MRLFEALGTGPELWIGRLIRHGVGGVLVEGDYTSRRSRNAVISGASPPMGCTISRRDAGETVANPYQTLGRSQTPNFKYMDDGYLKAAIPCLKAQQAQ